MERFIVEEVVRGIAWNIRDNSHEEFRMPKYAVSVNFGNKLDACRVCEILNKTWVQFLHNPQ